VLQSRSRRRLPRFHRHLRKINGKPKRSSPSRLVSRIFKPREFGQMVHLELSHADMKPAPLVRYEIAQDIGRTKQLFVLSIVAAAIIVVFAALFLSTLA
jgi:hypothetical protein